jgi:hypothetical protein
VDMEEGGLACIQGSISYYNRDLEVIILCFGVTFRNGRRCSEHNSRAHLTLVVDFQLNSFTALLSSCSSGFYFPLCFASLPRDTCTLNEAYDDTLIIHINLFFTSVLLSSHQRKQVGWYGSPGSWPSPRCPSKRYAQSKRWRTEYDAPCFHVEES